MPVARSLAPKLKLARDNQLGWGISAWVLGQEGPGFWMMLAGNYRVAHPKTPPVTGNYEQHSRAAARRIHISSALRACESGAGK